MMKQILLLLLALCSLVGCQRNEVTSIVLSEQEKVLEVGETLQLEAVVKATKDVGEFARVWASADESVASVTQDGLVTALAPGETLVTLTVGGRKAECRVGVKYFMQARRCTMREPYSTGLSDLYVLCLATKDIDTDDLSGTGEYLLLELFVPVGSGGSLPAGVYTMVEDFTPPAATGYSKEYEKFIPYTLSPGFPMGAQRWGTWHVRQSSDAEFRSLHRGTVEVRRSASGHSHIIRYDLSDREGHTLTGVYEGEIRGGK